MNPNDLWQHKLDARVKTLAASTGKLQRLPHEEWLFGKEGPIEGCPSTVEVEASLIYDAVNARDYLLQVIASSNFVSAQQLKKLVQTHQETLRKSDKSWWLEEEWWKEDRWQEWWAGGCVVEGVVVEGGVVE